METFTPDIRTSMICQDISCVSKDISRITCLYTGYQELLPHGGGAFGFPRPDVEYPSICYSMPGVRQPTEHSVFPTKNTKIYLFYYETRIEIAEEILQCRWELEPQKKKKKGSEMQMIIVFDNPSNTYYTGQNVTGRLVVTLPKPKKFREITVQCKGEADVHWEEHRRKQRRGRRRRVTEQYTSHEDYFECTHRVAGEMELQPGEYTYPFNFLLPYNIPSSFEGSYGQIRYTIKGKVDRPWRFDHVFKTAFTVICPLDLNKIPSVKEPSEVQMSKHFGCCWCKSGPLELTVHLPYSGYVPGQTIPFNVDIENNSDVLVYPIKCALRKEITWIANSPRNKTKTEKIVIADIAVAERIDPHNSKTLHRDIKIPPAPPSKLENCNIIGLTYAFRVKAVPESFHQALKAKIPITLGTVPLVTGPTKFVTPEPGPAPSAPYEDNDVTPPSQPPPPGFVPHIDPSTAPGAPPPYPDLPPPSYEESVFGGKNIRDENDGEHTMGPTDFTPAIQFGSSTKNKEIRTSTFWQRGQSSA